MLSLWAFFALVVGDDVGMGGHYNGLARLYLAVVSAFAVLIVMWSFGTFVLLRIIRFRSNRQPKSRGR